jgi:hypothetical protein
VDELIKLSFEKAAKKAKELFYEMKRDTDRKRLAADVEIKVTNISLSLPLSLSLH